MDINIDLNDYDVTDSFYNRKAARGIIRKGDKYLMIRGNCGDIKFPGGGVEEGESLTETLIREVREETGYPVMENTISYYGKITEKRAGIHKDILIMDSSYFTCEVSKEPGSRNLDDYEKERGYECVWITLDEAISLNRSIDNTENCPWVIRDTKAMEYILGK